MFLLFSLKHFCGFAKEQANQNSTDCIGEHRTLSAFRWHARVGCEAVRNLASEALRRGLWPDEGGLLT